MDSHGVKRTDMSDSGTLVEHIRGTFVPRASVLYDTFVHSSNIRDHIGQVAIHDC